MGKRRKTLKIWLKRTQDRGVVEGVRLDAKDTKNIRGQRQTFSRSRTLFFETHFEVLGLKASSSRKLLEDSTSVNGM